MLWQDVYYYLWFLTASGLVIYCSLCILIYTQSKMKSFLYYSLYNIFLLLYILAKVPHDLWLDNVIRYLYDTYNLESFSSYIQTIYNPMLLLFYTEFLDLEVWFPRFKKAVVRYVVIQITVSTIFFLWCVFFASEVQYKLYFLYVFLPSIVPFVVYGIYILLKIKIKLKYFIIIGILAYNLLAFFSLYISLNHSYLKVLPIKVLPITYYNIGIILESFVFAIGLGYKVKMLYIEKLDAQQKIIQEQKEKQSLEERHIRELAERLATREKELREILQRAETEKINAITTEFEKTIYTLRLETLQSQMNPHFIFNALNSIKAYFVRNDTRKAIQYLNKFAKLIRKILENSYTDSISLAEELETLELYVHIENIRFEQKINFTIKNPDAVPLAGIRVPGLILQPFLENAIWHGLMQKEGKRELSLTFSGQNENVLLQIRDNGIGREKAQNNLARKSIKKASLGLMLGKERLINFNRKQGTNYHFNIIDLYDENGNPAGTEVDFYFEI